MNKRSFKALFFFISEEKQTYSVYKVIIKEYISFLAYFLSLDSQRRGEWTQP